MTEIQELKHRINIINDDLKALRKFIYENNLINDFRKQSSQNVEGEQHLNNMEIACDLKNNECLSWLSYNQVKINKVIEILKDIEVDGETMETIIRSVGMSQQIHRQLTLQANSVDTLTLLEEKQLLEKNHLNNEITFNLTVSFTQDANITEKDAKEITDNILTAMQNMLNSGNGIAPKQPEKNDYITEEIRIKNHKFNITGGLKLY